MPPRQAVVMSATIDASVSPDSVSLHGRVLLAVSGGSGGEAAPGTRFEYTEEGDLVSARYAGGPVRLGFRVGTRSGNHLQFRYVHITKAGEAASGRADARLELLPDGRVRLHEIWAQVPGRDEGARVVEEAPAGRE